MISSPAISRSKVTHMIRMLEGRQKEGVEIIVVTIEPDSVGHGDVGYWMQLHDEMRSAGFRVMLTRDFCQHYAIIDYKVVWYGSINHKMQKNSRSSRAVWLLPVRDHRRRSHTANLR